MKVKSHIFTKILAILFISSLSFQAPLFALLDLNGMAQDFILETKKIEIPGYPDAFNPSIVQWNDQFLMSFRIRDPITKSTDQIGFIQLDKNFELVGSPHVLDRYIQNPSTTSYAQDPRLINSGGRLYIVFSNLEKVEDKEIRRMFVSELFFDGVRFFIKDPECLLNFEGCQDKRQEKNWAPFDYQGHLLLAYSILPHRILFPLLGSGSCENFAFSQGDIQWDWGELRGGTPALVIGNEYLAFFHSSKEMKTKQSDGKKVSHYFMGAYTFSLTPPFNITKISPEPLVDHTFYTGPIHKTWKPLRVVFPGGYVFDENYIWVAYGRQDHEAWVVKLDKQKLLQSLVPVSSIE